MANVVARKPNVNKRTLAEVTFKKIKTVGDLKTFLGYVFDDTAKINIFSDPEGNSINKILCIMQDKYGVSIIPWEE